MNEVINSDTLKVAADTLSNQGVFNHISLNLDNITSNSFVLIILGYSVVFLALLFLYICISYMAKVLAYSIKKRFKKEGAEIEDEEIVITGEINAAISMALILHFQELHDLENTVLTIKKVQRPYSPWSSKLYGLRQYPKK